MLIRSQEKTEWKARNDSYNPHVMLHRYLRAVASTKAEKLVVLFHFFFYLVTLFVIVAVAFVCLLENLENVHVVLHCLILKKRRSF